MKPTEKHPQTSEEVGVNIMYANRGRKIGAATMVVLLVGVSSGCETRSSSGGGSAGGGLPVAGNAPTLLGLDTTKPMSLPFTVQAAYNDDTMFFHMGWEGDKGDTHDYFRFTSGAWRREGGTRRDAQATLDGDVLRGSTSLNSTIYESRVSFMLDDPDGPNAVPMFANFGCMMTCHDNSRAMPTWVETDGEVHKYLPDDAMFAGSRLDLWHHRLARANPIGLSDDQWVGQRIGDEGDGGGGSRHGDAGTSPFATASFNDATPQWVFDPATTPNGENAFKFEDLWTSPLRYFTDASAENIGPNAPNAVGIDYNDAIATGYVPSEGDTVPRRRLRQTAGSRGDITADGTFFTPSAADPLFGRWDSNIQRALVTGNPDDTDLADSGIYNIAFAVHKGMVTVRDHYVSFSYTLSLNGGPADIQASRIAGSGRNVLPDFSDRSAFPVTNLNLFLPGITSDDFLIGANVGGPDYIDASTGLAVDQVHGGAASLIDGTLGCRDCHTVTRSETFAPVNPGGFFVGAMETFVPQRGGVHAPTPIPEQPSGGEPTGAALWEIITLTDPYESWAQFPGAQGTIDSTAPHGPLAQVFINVEAEAALVNFTGQLPDGSIIVKRSFDANMEESGDSITAMWKVLGYSLDDNDWFWGRFDFDGTIVAEGMIGGCIACHGAPGPRANDFVFLHQF